MARYIQLTDLSGDPFYWNAELNVGALIPIDATDPNAGTAIYGVYGPTLHARETAAAIAAAANAISAFATIPITTVDGRAGLLSTQPQNPYVIESCGVDDLGRPLSRLLFEVAGDGTPPFRKTVAELLAIFGPSPYVTLTKIDGGALAWWCNLNVQLIAPNDADDPSAGTTIYPIYGESFSVRETPAAVNALVQLERLYVTAAETTVDGRAAIMSAEPGAGFGVLPAGEVVEGGAPISVVAPGTNCHVSTPIRATVAALNAIFATLGGYIQLTDLDGEAFYWFSNVGMLVPIDATDPNAGTTVYPVYGDPFAARETVAAINALAQAVGAYTTQTMVTVDGRNALVNVDAVGDVYVIASAGATADGDPLSVIRWTMGCEPMSPPVRKTVAQLFAIFGP